MGDRVEALRARVEQACKGNQPLEIIGGASKRFLGRTPIGEPLEISQCRGIISYEPTELVLTARAGTPIEELQGAVEEAGQMLAFEPPRFAASATLGGTIACGLSGPRRPYAGAARDFVLGVKCINGKGELLSFGGQVMKNVAGYDLSRLMTGAMGCLGVLVEVSLKVLPRPELEQTVSFELCVDDALEKMVELAAGTTPLSAAAYTSGTLYLRLCGTHAGVQSTVKRLGGETLDTEVWTQIRELGSPALEGADPLWRVCVPANTPHDAEMGASLIDWGGGLRWLRTQWQASEIQSWAEQRGGHARLFKGGGRDAAAFHPLKPELLALHQRLKSAFDPAAILNPGRMYAEI